MSKSDGGLLSFVIPVYNEGTGLPAFHKSLLAVVKQVAGEAYEIIYCDDGSNDQTPLLVRSWHNDNPRVKLIRLSRNFGKENALTAGLDQARGQAILMIDGDGQHPIKLIPEFIKKWRAGAQVVIGVRTGNSGEGWFKRVGSRLFHQLFNRLADRPLVPGSTDFRLIDRTVQEALANLKETDRAVRGLIDWLGFKRAYIHFMASPRGAGAAGYSRGKLMKLATYTFVSMTPLPLYLFGYLGVFITAGALILGSAVIVEQVVLSDPWHWHFSGTAMISILLLFLVGILLMAQGMLSLYISHIHSQTKRRPLYVIDYEESAGVKPDSRP